MVGDLQNAPITGTRVTPQVRSICPFPPHFDGAGVCQESGGVEEAGGKLGRKLTPSPPSRPSALPQGSEPSSGPKSGAGWGGDRAGLDGRVKLCCEIRLDFPYLKIRCLLISESDQRSFRMCPAFRPGKWKHKSTERGLRGW